MLLFCGRRIASTGCYIQASGVNLLYLTMKINKALSIAVAVLFSVLPCAAFAQNAGEENGVGQKRLFDYPVVPDTIVTLENRTNYIVQNFWNNYDFSAPIRDEKVFEATFRDYVTFFKYAHKTIVISCIKDMMRKAESNKSNFLLIADIAERSLYAPEAEYWSDEVYIPFLESIVDNNMLKNAEKERYKYQLELLKNNLMGDKAQDFEMKLADGSKKKLSEIEGKMIFLFFNDESCEDCSIARLRLSTDVTLNKLIDAGEVAFVCVYMGKYSDDWASRARSYHDKWIIGANEDIADKYDLRIQPSIYILDSNKVILDKNINVEGIKRLLN